MAANMTIATAITALFGVFFFDPASNLLPHHDNQKQGTIKSYPCVTEVSLSAVRTVGSIEDGPDLFRFLALCKIFKVGNG
jgi:hypothetical protein